MTNDKLRKQIHVVEYNLTKEGIEIKYIRFTDGDELGTKKTIWLNPEETARQLSIICSIDSWESQPFQIYIDNVNDTFPVDWITFSAKFILSQWEALTLAIRHEMSIEIEKDSNLLEMDKAIEALRNI